MMKILDHYIDQLLDKSTPQAPVWNIEKIKNGGASTWNYIDGCMIKAILELYHITRNGKYLEFADAFIDYFVQEDGSITSYDPKEYNLDNVNAGKTLFDLYELTGPRPVGDPAPHEGGQLLAQEDLSQPGLAGRHLHGPALLYAVRSNL